VEIDHEMLAERIEEAETAISTTASLVLSLGFATERILYLSPVHRSTRIFPTSNGTSVSKV
jgi:hypothetical protein